MTPRDFRNRYRSLPDGAVSMLWAVYLGADLPHRGDLIAALDRIEDAHRLDLYSTRPHALA